MPDAKFELRTYTGKTLWTGEFRIPESGQLSVGKSFVCDVRCEFFASSEWVLLTEHKGFLSLGCGSDIGFGFRKARLFFRRGRILTCEIVGLEDEKYVDADSRPDFSDPQMRELLPAPDVYRDDGMRMTAAEILMSDAVFDRWRSPRSSDAPSLAEVVKYAACNSHLLFCGYFPANTALRRFIDCVMMISSFLYAEGPLTKLLRTDSVREVMFNGYADCWVEDSAGLGRRESPFSSWADLRAWLDHHASLSGREVVSERGCSDFSLSVGARVHVAMTPVTRESGYVSIRCHRENSCSLDRMVSQSTLTQSQRELLVRWVKEKKNILLAGATSSGKTTMVKLLAECCDPQERLVILEDVPELRISHPHCVYLQTAGDDSSDGRRSVGLDSLLREALRMRPDRLIVGECRGQEAFALVQALHTGHRGSFSTLHANSASDAIKRLEALLVRAEPTLSNSVVRQLVSGAFDAVVFMERDADSKRRVSQMILTGEIPC
ncbi:MAG: CpaF family protein [Proteobacteria bacterium]|nr:CpaF family protein [Pseudomonadota bacterium]